MLSPSDTILIFVVALLLFGPEQLPKIARQLGDAMRHIQSTTSSFMAEMDRAASAADRAAAPQWPPPADSTTVDDAADTASTLPGSIQHSEEPPDSGDDAHAITPQSPNPSP